MRRCRFCSRWFRNRQAVRRHLGYCAPYQAIPPELRTRLEQVFACVSCLQTLGPDVAAKITHDEVHAQRANYGGCITCGSATWQSAGWHRPQRT